MWTESTCWHIDIWFRSVDERITAWRRCGNVYQCDCRALHVCWCHAPRVLVHRCLKTSPFFSIHVFIFFFPCGLCVFRYVSCEELKPLQKKKKQNTIASYTLSLSRTLLLGKRGIGTCLTFKFFLNAPQDQSVQTRATAPAQEERHAGGLIGCDGRCRCH